MKALESLLKSHPATDDRLRSARAGAARALADCAAACTICADACLAEKSVASLTRCIRVDLECADVCTLASRAVLRHDEADAALLRPIIGVCVTACQLCRDECERHAHAHDHCRLCALACREAMRACNEFLGLISDTGVGIAPALVRKS
jgi:hypothetical protein